MREMVTRYPEIIKSEMIEHLATYLLVRIGDGLRCYLTFYNGGLIQATSEPSD